MSAHDDISPRPVADPFGTLTAIFLVLLAIALLWGLADGRRIDGVAVWVKPAKFSLSLGLHFATMLVIARAMAEAGRNAAGVAAWTTIMGGAALFEIGYIFFMAAQALPSHYNLATPLSFVLYHLMGVGAVILVAGPCFIVRAALRDPGTRFGPATREGLWWGALLSAVLTIIVAGALSTGTGRFVGVPGPDAAVLPIVGWSAKVGDLRVPHFFSLHALQVLPLAGLWLDRTGRGSVRAIRIAALGWTLIVLATFAQALMGLPLIRLS